MGYFGSMKHNDGAVYTGRVAGAITATMGDNEAQLHVVLLPNGRFEIQMTNQWGDQVGHVIPPRGGKQGKRIITGTLNTALR